MKKLVLLFAVLLAVGISTKASDKIPGLKIDLPNFVGLEKEEAVAKIAELGLTEGMVKRVIKEKAKGNKIIKQYPEYKKGMKVNLGDTINLEFSDQK